VKKACEKHKIKTITIDAWYPGIEYPYNFYTYTRTLCKTCHQIIEDSQAQILVEKGFLNEKDSISC
jgi:hypothetical protein